MPYREQKVAEAIKHAVAEIILEELGDPKLGFITITAAVISADYKKATIYFSSIGDENQQAESLKHLNRAAGFIKSRIKDKVVLRYIPEIVFEIDTLLQEEQRIGKVIDELNKNQTTEK
jgi:ribosome-binding factor A